VVETVTQGPAAPGAGTSSLGSPNAYLRTLAGSATAGFQDGVGTQARFSNVRGLAVDGAGNVYCGESNSHSVRRIGVDGRVTTVAGTSGASGSTDGNGDVASFNQPVGVVVNQDGTELFVADAMNRKIRRVALSDGGDPTEAGDWVVSTLAGTGADPGSSPETNGLGSVATFETVWGICRDSVGALYVTESAGDRVRRIQFLGGDPILPASWRVSTFAGSGARGSADGAGASASFAAPTGIAIDREGNVFVADSLYGLVRKITPDRVVSTFASSINQPYGLALDAAGFVYIPELGAHDVVRVTPDGTTRRVVAGWTGVSGSADGPGDTALVASPLALARDASGNLYIADGPGTIGSRVRVVHRVIETGQAGLGDLGF